MKCEICNEDKSEDHFTEYHSRITINAEVRLDNIAKTFCNECYEKLLEKAKFEHGSLPEKEFKEKFGYDA